MQGQQHRVNKASLMGDSGLQGISAENRKRPPAVGGHSPGAPTPMAPSFWNVLPWNAYAQRRKPGFSCSFKRHLWVGAGHILPEVWETSSYIFCTGKRVVYH